MELGAYFLVRENAEVKLEGPCHTWQEACLKAFGRIDTKFSVKCIGQDYRLILDKKWVQRRIHDNQNWFSPYLPNCPLGRTFIADEAMGPPEISREMADAAHKIKTARTRAEVEVAHSLACQYLRFLPLELCAKFDGLYRVVLALFCDCQNLEMITGRCGHCNKFIERKAIES